MLHPMASAPLAGDQLLMAREDNSPLGPAGCYSVKPSLIVPCLPLSCLGLSSPVTNFLAAFVLFSSFVTIILANGCLKYTFSLLLFSHSDQFWANVILDQAFPDTVFTQCSVVFLLYHLLLLRLCYREEAVQTSSQI